MNRTTVIFIIYLVVCFSVPLCRGPARESISFSAVPHSFMYGENVYFYNEVIYHFRAERTHLHATTRDTIHINLRLNVEFVWDVLALLRKKQIFFNSAYC